MSRDVEMIWSLGFLNGELRSHPHKKLVDHLRGVAVLSEGLAEAYSLPVDKSLIKCVAITHDLGKAHLDFQAYLDKKGPGVNHAEPSSWFTYLLTGDLWCAEAVRRHHTHLYNCEDLANDWMPDVKTEDKIRKMLHKFLPEWPLPLTQKEWKKLEDIFFDGPEVTLDQWLLVRLLYSVLVAADRMDAIGIKEYSPLEISPFSPISFEAKTDLEQWREKIRRICLDCAEQVDRPGVYTLTLPTGSGKTLLGLEIARKWADKFNCRTIVYVLPFISIVEQNAAEAKKVFGMGVQEDHSLAYAGDQEPHSNDVNDVSWHRMLSLFRYWRDPVIVTTMVQLWEALFNANANKTMNFHKLSQAVVILDEPQSIDSRLWRGLSDTLNYLSDKLGTTFLFMTATQPRIEKDAELAPEHLSWPFERHRYLVKNKKYDIDELIDLLQDNIPITEGSGLIVLNTKRAAIKAYNALKTIITDAPVLFLSTWMTPWHRKQVLEQLRDLEEKNIRRYLVATQVVEAGVNLDFDWVFRDMGPLDSIIQVAGRCNRHLKRSQPGKVLIAELMNGNLSYTSSIYDDILIFAARETLPRDVELGEKEITELLDEYYARILDGLRSEPILEKLSMGMWEDIPPLIEKQALYEKDVIIEQDGKVRWLYEQLQNKQWSLEERHEKKQLLRELRQYIISIPEKYVPLCRSKMSEIVTRGTMEPFCEVFGGRAYFLTRDGVSAGLYDETLGFVPPEFETSGAPIIDD